MLYWLFKWLFKEISISLEQLVETVYSLADMQTILHSPIGISRKLELEIFCLFDRVDLLDCSSNTFWNVPVRQPFAYLLRERIRQ